MRHDAGQAMVESTIVLLFLCVVFFLVFDLARLLTCRTVLDYAAARCARARTVGFNDFMVLKTARLGAMAVSGACRTEMNGESSPSTATLISRMGSYLQTETPAETSGILDFDLWQDGKLGWQAAEPGGEVSELTMRVWQKQPVFRVMNLGEQAVAEGDGEAEVTLHGAARIESHYPYYLK